MGWTHFLLFEKGKEQSLFLFLDVCRSFRGIRTSGPEEDCLISPTITLHTQLSTVASTILVNVCRDDVRLTSIVVLSTEKGLTDVKQRRGAVTELSGTTALKKMAEDHVNTDAGEHQGIHPCIRRIFNGTIIQIVPLNILRIQPFLLAPRR